MTKKLSVLIVAVSVVTGLYIADARLLPRTPIVAQIAGSVAGFRWNVAVRRGQGPSGSRTPCITATLEPPRGQVGSGANTLCGPFRQSPLIDGQTANSGPRRRSVIGLVLRPEVAKVRVWLRGRAPRLIDARLLSLKRAHRSNVLQFRYAAIAFAGPTCLRRLAAYSVSGSRAGPVLEMRCSP